MTNWRPCNDFLRQRGALLICLDKDMTWQAEEGGTSWPPAGVLRCSIQACLMVKVLFNLPLRQTICMVSGIPEMAVPDWPVPDFSTPQAEGRGPFAVQIPHRRGPGSPNLLTDSTRIKFPDGEWLARKHGTHRKR